MVASQGILLLFLTSLVFAFALFLFWEPFPRKKPSLREQLSKTFIPELVLLEMPIEQVFRVLEEQACLAGASLIFRLNEDFSDTPTISARYKDESVWDILESLCCQTDCRYSLFTEQTIVITRDILPPTKRVYHIPLEKLPAAPELLNKLVKTLGMPDEIYLSYSVETQRLRATAPEQAMYILEKMWELEPLDAELAEEE